MFSSTSCMPPATVAEQRPVRHNNGSKTRHESTRISNSSSSLKMLPKWNQVVMKVTAPSYGKAAIITRVHGVELKV